MRWTRWTAVLLAGAAVAAGCSSASKSAAGDFDDPGNCTVVELASSPEKIDLMNQLAKEYNATKEKGSDGKCIFVRPQSKSSGGAAQLLYGNWDENAEGPKPVVWSPAASAWGGVVNQQLATQNRPAIVGKGDPFMLTPLVIAMPKPMADALGYPATPIGWGDVLNLARNPQGWAQFGHPEWGAFKLGKTNPNFSTSGLNALVAQADAAVGKTSGLTAEDLARPDVVDFGTGVESSVVHYGDTTLTFLDNLYKADQRGTALSYVSAVAVEEKSVIDYNTGNPDGILSPGEKPRPPRIPLVAIYPKEGTLYSDSPFFILDADWVSQAQKDGAAAFERFVSQPENQQKALQFGFRPGVSSVAIGDPINAANGVDPNQPKSVLEVPSAPVLGKLLDNWSAERKKAKVTMVIDVSGSMGELIDQDDPGKGTRLDLAKQAAIASLPLFADDDQVSLSVFSTNLGPSQAEQPSLQLVPMGRVGDNREVLRQKIQSLVPVNGTPLYDVTAALYQQAVAPGAFDPARINAIVLLTDGQNDDGDDSDDSDQLQALINSLRSGNEGQASTPVRIFPIAYSGDADLTALNAIADAASSKVYDASDPTTIDQVLTAVVSNFWMGTTLQERLRGPAVAAAATSPVVILAAGAAVGIGLAADLPIVVAVLLGVLAVAVRIVFAAFRPGELVGNTTGAKIDSFSLNEPWRKFVQDAQVTSRRFDDLVASTHDAAMQERMRHIAERIASGVEECWVAAGHGDRLTRARARLDVGSAGRTLQKLRAGGEPEAGSPAAQTVQSLQAQLDAAARLDATIATTRDRLQLLDARMDEALALAVELSVDSTRIDDLSGLNADVEGVVGEMETLRLGLEQA